MPPWDQRPGRWKLQEMELFDFICLFMYVCVFATRIGVLCSIHGAFFVIVLVAAVVVFSTCHRSTSELVRTGSCNPVNRAFRDPDRGVVRSFLSPGRDEHNR